MDKETLSNYGWIVICVLVLAVMIALAGPFGTFVAGAVKSTTAGLFGVNQNALGAAGITIDDQAFANCEHLETEIRNTTADYSGDTCCKECGAIVSAGKYTIPVGGKYYVGVTSEYNITAYTAVYNAGEEFPDISDGDVYVYGDYEYRYNALYDVAWKQKPAQNGWGVRCKNNVAEPGPILESINGKPITTLNSTFYGMTNMTIAPVIPNTVTNISSIFLGCSSLNSEIIIPSSAECDYACLYWAFRDCTSLANTVHVPCHFLESYASNPTNSLTIIEYYCVIDNSIITDTVNHTH